MTWEVHGDGPTGPIATSATFQLAVPLASMVTRSITVTAPASGTKCYLVLRAAKSGTTLFEETDDSFDLQ